jgi:hypothetical protein
MSIAHRLSGKLEQPDVQARLLPLTFRGSSPVGLMCPGNKIRIGFQRGVRRYGGGGGCRESSLSGQAGRSPRLLVCLLERLTEVTGMPGFKVAST